MVKSELQVDNQACQIKSEAKIEMIMCTRCVLTSTTPGIVFDESGVCNYCHTYEPMQPEGEARLLEVLDAFRDRGRKYDCLIGISGGRDSTYTLWKLVHDYGMRVLAFSYVMPWVSEQAQENMQRALDILDVDCQFFELPKDVHRNATVKALKAWGHHPSSSMIPIVCTHCKCIWPEYFRIARERGVPLIFLGANPLETASFKKPGLGGARYYHKLSNVPRLAAKSVKELAGNPRYLTSVSWGTVAKMYLMAGHNSPYLEWRYKDITVECLFDFLPWNEQEVMATISENLGWRKAPEVGSYWRFDCRLDYVRRLMYAHTIGVTELRDLFSKMICEGQITRERALKRLETEEFVPKDVVEDVLNSLGMTLADLPFLVDQWEETPVARYEPCEGQQD